MKSCANGHPEITFKEEIESCPVCVVWSEYGLLVKQVAHFQKKDEKRKKVNEAIKNLLTVLEID